MTRTIAAIFMFSVTTYASVWDLSDANSTVSIVDDDWHGVFDWLVDGVDHLAGQSFWYRIGSVETEQAFGGVNGTGNLALQGSSMLASNVLQANYLATNQQAFEVTATYTLTGGISGSGLSQLQTTLLLSNTGSDSLELHFFQYSSFLLNGFPDNDIASVSGNDATQSDPTRFAVTSPSLVPSHFQVDHNENILFGQLFAAGPATLNDNAGPYGPDVVAFAYQWDMNIEAGGSQNITILQNLGVVPEPSTWLLLACAGVVVGLRERFRRKSIS